MQRNSEGSVYLRKDGRYCACYCRDGKRTYFYGKTRAEAVKKLKAYTDELARNNYLVPETCELRAMILHWLESEMYISLKPKSYESKRYTVEHLILPYLGERVVSSITRADVQDLIIKLSKQYAWWTVKKVYDTLNQFYKSAILDRRLLINPVLGVKLPRKNTGNCKPIRFFSEEELHDILTVATETYPNGTPITRLGYAFHLLAYTGMRIGEAIALTWDDVDFSRKLIYVNKNSVTFKNPDPEAEQKYLTEVQDSTKTASSTRVIPISRNAEMALLRLREINGQFDTVLASSTGRPADRRDLARAFSGIQARAGIEPPGTLHSLRHTFATRLIERGVDVKVISSLLGHSDISITYNTYVHVLQRQKVQAIAALDEI